MAYFDLRNDRGLGCSCAGSCSACSRANRALGETYEPDDDEDAPPPRVQGRAGLGEADRPPGARAPQGGGGEARLVEQLLRSGVRDENRLTNALFFARHPERQGRPIARGEAAAAKAWIALRDRWVRPRLHRPAQPRGPGPAAGPAPAANSTGACPVEDPAPRARHPTGQPCGAGARKCWPAAGRSLDLVDADLPCTAQRDPATYRAVLRYFNVADARNARYAPTGDTYCNIFAHDATRALRASIPHWVRDESQREEPPLGWRELRATPTFHWLGRHGPAAGWHPIDTALIEAMHRLAGLRGAGAAIGGIGARLFDPALSRLPAPLADAAARAARASHADPLLLRQDSYIAQQFANLGFPTVVCWANPKPKESGHIALIAPEAPGSLGARTKGGAFMPRSTQAGRKCFEEQLANWVVLPNYATRRFFIHA